MTDERTWLLIGAICGIAVASAWAWFSVSRQIDAALSRAFKP